MEKPITAAERITARAGQLTAMAAETRAEITTLGNRLSAISRLQASHGIYALKDFKQADIEQRSMGAKEMDAALKTIRASYAHQLRFQRATALIMSRNAIALRRLALHTPTTQHKAKIAAEHQPHEWGWGMPVDTIHLPARG